MAYLYEPSLSGSPTSTSSDEMIEFEHDLDMLDLNATNFASFNDFDVIDFLTSALEQATCQLNDKQCEVRAKSAQWTTKTKDRIRRQTVRLEDRRAQILQQLAHQYDSIHERMNQDSKTVQLRDKVTFVLGVANVCVSPVVVLRFTTWVPLYYTLQCTYMLMLRYVIYKVRQWHYFIFDLCYFVNAMTLLYLWACRSSQMLFIATYCLTNGPVAWAIVAWRNSLVFHSLDKMTSVFIHIFPALVTYTIRWFPELNLSLSTPSKYRNDAFPALASLDTLCFRDVMLYSTTAYLVWQLLYFVFIMIGRRDKIEKGLRMTSYSWLLNDSHGRYGFIHKLVFAFGPKYKIYMFMLLQLIYNLVTTVPTYFLFQYFWLHSLFLMTMFGTSVYNGASYYIDVFSRRYIQEMENTVTRKENADSTQDQKHKTA